MRKIISLNSLAFLLLLLTVIFASCKDGEAPAETSAAETTLPPHVHEWSDWTETFTCTEDGVRERSCACGAKESEEVTAPGHNIGVWKWDPPATCTQSGMRHLECRVCGYRMKQEEEKALNHWKYKVVTSRNPTCTVPGIEEKVCELCSEVIETKEIPVLKHQLSAVRTEIEPTCTEKGREVAHCFMCLEIVYSNEINNIRPVIRTMQDTLIDLSTDIGYRNVIIVGLD